ncbi:uncharacterized protein LOC100388015 [Callithrix jacchus]
MCVLSHLLETLTLKLQADSEEKKELSRIWSFIHACTQTSCQRSPYQKAIFADEDGSGDSDDEEEISEHDRLETVSSNEEAEEEENADQYMTAKGIKQGKLEELEEDSEVNLPAFADRDDELEGNSAEGEVK